MYQNFSNAFNLSDHWSNDTANSTIFPPEVPRYGTIINFLNGMVIPALVYFGILGNVLNLVVLSSRISKKEPDALEKSALVPLIALAVSDLLFCAVTALGSVRHPSMCIRRLTFRVAQTMYGPYFKNLFIKTSTWFTLLVGVARYVGICYPMKARLFISLKGVSVSVVAGFITWTVFLLPYCWSWKLSPMQLAPGFYYLEDGAFDGALEKVFSYLWLSLGYIIPTLVLIFCNFCLIAALRRSRKLHQETCSARHPNKAADVHTRITVTLVILIFMYVFLVSPSEVAAFLSLVMPTQEYRLLVAVANTLQVTNLTCHFILYCIINATFRRAMSGTCVALLGLCRRGEEGGQAGQGLLMKDRLVVSDAEYSKTKMTRLSPTMDQRAGQGGDTMGTTEELTPATLDTTEDP